MKELLRKLFLEIERKNKNLIDIELKLKQEFDKTTADIEIHHIVMMKTCLEADINFLESITDNLINISNI